MHVLEAVGEWSNGDTSLHSGNDEYVDGRGADAGSCQGQHDLHEGAQARTPVDHGRLLEVVGYTLEESPEYPHAHRNGEGKVGDDEGKMGVDPV
jgi:hypothetical protein